MELKEIRNQSSLEGVNNFLQRPNKTYIILLNYNGWEDTLECLESVLKNGYENYQVIVVDNASPNKSMQHIINWAEGKQGVVIDETSQLQYLSQPLELKPLPYVLYTKDEASKGGDPEKELVQNNPMVLIQAGKNKGFAAGNNIGIKYALIKNDFNYIWLLNNDTVIEKDTLSDLIEYAEKNKIDICGSVLKDYEDPTKILAYGGTINKFLGTSKHLLKEKEINSKLDYIVGASFLIVKKVIDNIGMLPEDYFLYYEETDYCFNAKRNKFILGVAQNSFVYHKRGASTGGIKKNEFSYLSRLISRKLFCQKYLNNFIGIRIGYLLVIINKLRKLHFSMIPKILGLIINRNDKV